MLGRLGGAMIGSGRLTMRGAGSRTGAIRPPPRAPPRGARFDSEPALDVASASRRLPLSRAFSCARASLPGADFLGGGAAFLPGEDFFGGGADRLAAAGFFSAFLRGAGFLVAAFLVAAFLVA